MFDVAPGKLRDMYQPIDTFQVYKSAEINDVGDGAGDQVPNIHAVKDLLTETTPLLFQNRAATQHNVIAETVQLNDPAAQRLTHKVFQVRHTADVHEGSGQEAPHSKIQNQTTLHNLYYSTLNGVALFSSFLNPAPRPLKPGPLLGENQTTICIFLGHYLSINNVTQ